MTKEKIDFLKLEYEISIETYKTQITTTIQIVTGFVALGVTILGIGISYKKSWLFLAAGLLAIVTFMVIKSAERTTRVFILRAIEIENILGSKSNSVVSFWAFYFYNHKGYKKILEAISETDTLKRYDKLKNISSKLDTSIYMIIIVLSVLILFFLSFFLQTLNDWAFF